MIRGLDGDVLKVALLEPSAGIVCKQDGDKVLVFIDPPTGMQFHIPMTDKQMDALHQQWHESKIVIADVGDIPAAAAATNGHRQANGG